MDRVFLLLILLFSASISLLHAQETKGTEIERVTSLATLVETHWSNNPEQAIAYSREALALLALSADPRLEGLTRFYKGSAHFVLGEYDSTLVEVNQLHILSKKTRNKKLQADATSLWGRVQRRQGNYARSLDFYQEALNLYLKLDEKPGIANSLDRIGLNFRNLGDYDQALDFHLRALDIREALSDPQGVSMTLTNIGHVYRNLGNYNLSLDFYKRSLDKKEELGDERGIAISLFSIGDILLLQTNDIESLSFFTRALEINEELGDRHGIAITLNKLGDAYQNIGNSRDALNYLVRARRIFEDIGNKPGQATALISLGNIHSNLGNFDAAQTAIEQAIDVAEEIEAQRLIRDAYQNLTDIYERQGEYEHALLAHKRHKIAHDSLFNGESQAALAELQTRYQTREQKQEIDLLSSQRQIQRLWLGGLLGGILLLACIAVLIYSRYRIKNRANQALTEANANLEASLRRLRETQDRLIHAEKMASLGAMTSGVAHEIKNPLNFVKNFAQLSIELADELDGEINQVTAKLDSGTQENVVELLENLKYNSRKIEEHSKRADGIVHSMIQHADGKPGQFEPTDINSLLDEYVKLACRNVQTNQPNLHVEIKRLYDHSLASTLVKPSELGRVFLNILNNAFEAASRRQHLNHEDHAHLLTVETSKGADFIEIRISDNGPGIPLELQNKIFEPFFTTKPTGQGTGLGLSLSYNIIAEGHGGKLWVESEEGQGATFILTLPSSH